jgi:hypothetical protein
MILKNYLKELKEPIAILTINENSIDSKEFNVKDF